MMKPGLRYAHEQRIGLRCTRCTFNVEHHPEKAMVRCINRRCLERGRWRPVAGVGVRTKTLAIAMRQA